MSQHDPQPRTPRLDRRSLLFGGGALGASGLLAARAGAATSNPAAGLSPAREIDPQAMGLLQGSCTLTASDVQGPFWLDLGLVRTDITEGYPGVPLRTYFRVLDASSCAPIEGAAVDVWHCEALGAYSGFQSRGTQGLTFLRGIQLTDANGIAFFDTVYPGFYVGRTAHVHVKITPHPGSELTTQIYFPQSVNDRIYGLPPYDQNTNPQVTNSADGFYDPVREFDLRRDPNGNGILGGFTVVVA